MWYNKISQDLGAIPEFLDYYRVELEASRKEVKIYGNVEKNVAALPGITETRYTQLQEIEAVLNFLNIQLRQIKKKHFKNYLEAYAKALTSRDAEKYADAEKEVVDFELIVNEVALLRNQYLSILKGLESKNFMLGHIVKLRCAGFEDASV